MYALGAALHVEVESGLSQLRVDRGDELLYVCIARALSGIQLFLDHVVGIVLEILQRQILQFALQLVESQFVGEWGVEVACLFRYAMLGFGILCVAYLPHQVHSVGYHDEYHAHVLGER